MDLTNSALDVAILVLELTEAVDGGSSDLFRIALDLG
jgi:hypothetical protein